MNLLGKLFVKGLVTVLPIAVTVYLVYWLVGSVELVLRSLVLLVLPEEYYRPGMGFVASVIVVILVGALTYSVVTGWVFMLGARVLERVPLVRGLYGMLVDMTRFFVQPKKDAFSQVVMVRIGGGSAELMGLVTRESFDDLPDGVGGSDKLAVYLPLSYAMGGYMVVVDRANVQPVDMNREEALRFAVTAGMVHVQGRANDQKALRAEPSP